MPQQTQLFVLVSKIWTRRLRELMVERDEAKAMRDSVDNWKFPPIELRRFDEYEQKLGDMLRGKRAEKGHSLLKIEEELGIRRYMIVAIEKCDASAFENPYFVPSHVRSYARYLGLDPEKVYQQFCEESKFSLPESGTLQPLPNSPDAIFESRTRDFPWASSPQPTFSVSATSVLSALVLISLVGGAGYFGYSILKEFQQISSVPTELEPEYEFAENEFTPTFLLNSPSDKVGAFAESAPFTDLQNDLEPIGELKPGELGILAESRESAEDQNLVEPHGQPAVNAAVLAPPVAEPPKPRNEVKIFAARPAWVRVRAADDTVLLEKILDAGESYLVPKSSGELKLRAGNSGSVYFDIDGQLYGPAGRKTSVVKNLMLNAASLREKYELADEDALPKPAQSSLVAARMNTESN